MNEKKIEKKKPETKPAETVENNKNSGDTETREDSWAEDQNKKSYYYDDSYGYEIYDPAQDDDDDDDDDI